MNNNKSAARLLEKRQKLTCKLKRVKFNQKEESPNYLPFSISYSSPTGQFTQSRIHLLKLSIYSFIFCWIWIRNNNFVISKSSPVL